MGVGVWGKLHSEGVFMEDIERMARNDDHHSISDGVRRGASSSFLELGIFFFIRHL
jgi:hypothetical protein